MQAEQQLKLASGKLGFQNDGSTKGHSELDVCDVAARYAVTKYRSMIKKSCFQIEVTMEH